MGFALCPTSGRSRTMENCVRDVASISVTAVLPAASPRKECAKDGDTFAVRTAVEQGSDDHLLPLSATASSLKGWHRLLAVFVLRTSDPHTHCEIDQFLINSKSPTPPATYIASSRFCVRKQRLVGASRTVSNQKRKKSQCRDANPKQRSMAREWRELFVNLSPIGKPHQSEHSTALDSYKPT